MSILRRIARPMLASAFIAAGLDALRHPGPRVEGVRPLATRIASTTGLPDDPELLVRASGAAMATAGGLLATGRIPRTAALAMATAMVPNAYPNLDFWREKDPERRRMQRQNLIAAVSLIGGALIAAVDTQGRPGLAWRGRQGARRARRSARKGLAALGERAELG